MRLDIWKDRDIFDLHTLEYIPLYKLFLEFLNYPLFIGGEYIESNDLSEAENYYLEVLLSEYLDRPNKNVSEDNEDKLMGLQEKLLQLTEQIFIKKERVSSHNINVDIGYKVALSESGEIYREYEINGIDAFCIFAINTLSNMDILIKRCENCNRFFVPTKKGNKEIYCDNIYTDGKTCKEVGYNMKFSNDTLMKKYTQLRKNKNYYKNNGKDIEVALWIKYAKEKQRLWRKNLITDDGFESWLDNSENEFRECVEEISDLNFFREWLVNN